MLTKELYENYTEILKSELVPAMGCTEPIAIAYASAKARAALGENPEKISVSCSGNIIKNVKGVIVPNSGGQKGIETAAVLGAVGGDSTKELEVIANATDEARKLTKKLVAEKICDVQLAENADLTLFTGISFSFLSIVIPISPSLFEYTVFKVIWSKGRNQVFLFTSSSSQVSEIQVFNVVLIAFRNATSKTESSGYKACETIILFV